MSPSSEFLLLAATLLDALPPSPPISDSLLLQLHSVFGPMLVSALQLVDKKEVVRVALPSNRFVYQVASSTGRNYTIHMDPPAPAVDELHVIEATDVPCVQDIATLAPSTDVKEPPFRTPSPDQAVPRRPDRDDSGATPSKRQRKSMGRTGEIKRSRVIQLAESLSSMFCPCAGWAYGTLAGDRTVVCKHLLAVIIAHKTGREVHAEVGMAGVVALLGMNGGG
ncbi:hypothetical protein IAU60_006159 [Kwoniella sp. DSM 27419]